MKIIKNRDYTKITKIALSYGLQATGEAGIYELNGKKIDLSASGDSDWAVAKNIIDQLKIN